VKNWLENGGSVNNGQNPEKPYLFCGDSWAIRQDMKSQMRDGHGTELVKKKTGKPIRIKDIDSMVQTRIDVAKELGKSEKSIYPV